MSHGNGNGHVTPPESVGPIPPPPTVLGPLEAKSDRQLLEEAVRQSHHAWTTAASSWEWTRALAENVDGRFKAASAERKELKGQVRGIEQRLGIVERAPREGSHPQLERLVDLKLDEEETEVRRRREDIEETKRQREAAAVNRAKAWAIFFRGAALLLTAGTASLVTRACGG